MNVFSEFLQLEFQLEKLNVPRHGGREGKRNGNSNSIKIQSLYREIAIQLIINFIN